MATATEYSAYLHIDDLLTLQQPLTPEAHDELLFIVVHQSYELWFKLILHEMSAAVQALRAGRPWSALPPLTRMTSVQRLLLRHLDVLETMAPDGFLQFRDPLAPASGFQSEQFREIERRGAGEVWDAAVACLTSMRLVPAGSDTERCLSALTDVYRDHGTAPLSALHAAMEALIDFDEALADWRHHHALMAGRMIGHRQGTGGSLGVRYLESTLDRRLFPLLWELRSRL